MGHMKRSQVHRPRSKAVPEQQPSLVFVVLVSNLWHRGRTGSEWVHSLILQILDVVGQRLVSGFRKKEDSEAREDGYDSIDDPRQRFKICS